MGKNQESNQPGTSTRQAAYEITPSVYSASKKVCDKIPWVDFTQVGLARVGLAEVDSTLQPHFLITAIEGKLFSLSSTCFEHIVEVSHILIGKIHTGPNHEFPPHGMSKSCVASAKNGGLSLGENLHFLLLRQ